MFEAVPAKAAMHKPRTVLTTGESIQEAAAKMYHLHEEASPVVNETKEAVGYVSTDSLMTAMMKGLPPDTKVSDVMEPFPEMLTEEEIPSLRWEWSPPCLPVSGKDGELKGVLKAGEWLKAVQKAQQEKDQLLRALSVYDKEKVLIAAEDGTIKLTTSPESFQPPPGKLENLPFYQEITGLLHSGSSDAPVVKLHDAPHRLRVHPLTIGKKIYYAVRLKQQEAPVEEEGWKEKAEQMEMVIELSHDGIIMVDKKGFITMVNKEYADFIGRPPEELTGRHVTEVIENTRMHIVAETGVAEIADIQRIHGDYMVANRMPLYRDGELVGAVGKVLFKNLGGFKALKRRIENLEKELATYRGEWQETNQAKYQFEQLIGKSTEWEKTKQLARQAAETDSNVLLQGESGTGKELFAHAIHQASARAPGPFVKVNCAAIPGDLIESELFGYTEGSFTGAKRGGKKGKFEAAEGGTIFLDEIGELPVHMQVKLLRVLQEREVERVGSTASKPVDIRVIAATNRNLEKMIEDGDFRLDLYYRLNVFMVHIPALRTRPDDINVLLPYFLKKVADRLGKPVPAITSEAESCLLQYAWPGNTRELENVIERAVNVLKPGEAVDGSHFPPKLKSRQRTEKPPALQEAVQRAEKETIEQALVYTNGNKSKAAEILGVSRTALYEKITKYK
ncbi:sigma 54-interacting transcriptional regulator [Alkalicoccus saliphilus]|uniref:Sigma-54-dependent Fis family transcriptional regulator n=1 Tax=Alkalicoccus saliphilus TaxID=200989 RepID=A0A2T4U1Q9_9BACI|nr:sigma 54-interacting transcriptional regulator [Alkalicoccus saliphilus]PTL37330.1 sigma-54-dependent Fis family transcriptional regulator [Alkalicoccus saliphilus]